MFYIYFPPLLFNGGDLIKTRGDLRFVDFAWDLRQILPNSPVVKSVLELYTSPGSMFIISACDLR